MTQDNVTEDRMRATARLLYAKVVEVLEVREFLLAGSVRLGEMTITVVNGEPMSITMSPVVL